MLVNRALCSFGISILGLTAAAAAAAQPLEPRARCDQMCRLQKQLLWWRTQLDRIFQQFHIPDLEDANTASSAYVQHSSLARTSVKTSSRPLRPSSAFSTRTISSTRVLSTPTVAPLNNMSHRPGYRSVAYFVNWGIYGRKYTPDKVPVDKLTHILYSFGDNRDDGTVFLTDTWSDVEIHYPGDSWNDTGNNLYGNLKQLNLAKKKNRNLKVLLSIGGWTYTNVAKHMDGPASTPQGRHQFAVSCVDLIKNLGFDGIDIDWEYPQNPGQGEQLLLLLQEIRKAMDEYADQLASTGCERPHFELSIAAPAGKTNYQNLPLGRLGHVLDFVNLMGYDFAGSWDQVAGHQANLKASHSCSPCTPFNVVDVINAYVAAGIPSQKMVLGMPLYGRAFANTDGIGKPFHGLGEGSQEEGSWERGVWDYKALPRPGATEHIDEEAGASYSWDPHTRTVISYDTVEMARRKAGYIRQQRLGGAMWWELSGDRPDDQGSIITNVVRELGGPGGNDLEFKANWVTCKDSKYDNLKSGFTNDQ